MEDPLEFYGINFDGQATLPNVTAKYEQLTEFLVDQEIAFDEDTYVVASECLSRTSCIYLLEIASLQQLTLTQLLIPFSHLSPSHYCLQH